MFAAAMGGSVLVSGFMTGEATWFLMDFQFYRILRSDVELTFKNERGIDAVHEAARLPGVDHAEPVLHVAGTFYHGHRSRKGAITGLVARPTLTVPRDAEGRPIRIPDHGVAMTRKLADRPERAFPAGARAAPGLRAAGGGDYRQLSGHGRLRKHRVPESLDRRRAGGLGRATGHRPRSPAPAVQLATDHDPRHQQEMMRRLKTMPALQAVNTREELVYKLEETLLQNMWVLIGAEIIFAGVLFFGSILNSSLVSLAERSREVATLRVLGYGPWQIGSLLLRESLVVTLAGTLLGMPLGYGLTVLVAMAFESEMFRFPVVWSAGTWVWTFGLAVLFALASHLVVQRVIHRFDWLEALQAKE